MNKIDQHTHTTASDVILTPRELIDYARNNGLSTIAITDHDTIDGLAEGMKHARSLGLDLMCPRCGSEMKILAVITDS